MTDDLQRRRKRMKNVMGARQETGFKAFQMKNRRSRKPKFELRKSKRVYDKKKKDKKRNQIVTTQIAQAELRLEEFRVMLCGLREENRQLKELIAEAQAKLRLEEFRVMLCGHREVNRQLKELIAEINSYILDKLATWDAGDD